MKWEKGNRRIHLAKLRIKSPWQRDPLSRAQCVRSSFLCPDILKPLHPYCGVPRVRPVPHPYPGGTAFHWTCDGGATVCPFAHFYVRNVKRAFKSYIYCGTPDYSQFVDRYIVYRLTCLMVRGWILLLCVWWYPNVELSFDMEDWGREEGVLEQRGNGRK